VKESLENLSKYFEIIIFTASHQGYADRVIDILDPQGDLVSHRLFRNHCFQSKQGVYVKDLRIINRKMEDMILVDNALYSYGLQLANGVPIIPFYNCKEDAELLILSEYLMSLRDEPDVREINNSVFRYDCLLEADNLTNCFIAMFNHQKNKRGTSASKRNTSIGSKS
jgi:CTD small phosphatase-like protein 2